MSADRKGTNEKPAQANAASAPVPKEHRPTFGGGLLASKPSRNKGVTSATLISTTIHVLAVGAAVWSTLGRSVETEEDEVTVVELTQEFQPPPPPPPPPVDQPQVATQNFQTLSVPDIVPAEIPPPGEVTFRASDFTGQGVQTDGSSDGSDAEDEPVVAIGETPSFTPFTVAPQLRNRAEVGRALEREYPPLLRDAGVGGQVEVWIRISDAGQVEAVQVNQSSGHAALDAAALEVGQVMEFTPAMNRDRQVPVWVSIPITFQVR